MNTAIVVLLLCTGRVVNCDPFFSNQSKWFDSNFGEVFGIFWGCCGSKNNLKGFRFIQFNFMLGIGAKPILTSHTMLSFLLIFKIYLYFHMLYDMCQLFFSFSFNFSKYLIRRFCMYVHKMASLFLWGEQKLQNAI